MRSITEKNEIEPKGILSKWKAIGLIIFYCVSVFADNIFFVCHAADPINLDEFLKGASVEGGNLSSVEDVRVQQFFEGISISWKRRSLQETEAIVLVRSENECPDIAKDGKELYRGNGDSYFDGETFAGTEYCYGLFVTDSSGRISRIVTSDVIKKDDTMTFLFSWISNNRAIIFEIIIILVLTWTYKKTVFDLNRRKRKKAAL